MYNDLNDRKMEKKSNKWNKKEIMRIAWEIVRKEGTLIGEAMRMAWKAVKFLKRLRSEVVTFWYYKKGGEMREAHGTLMASRLPGYWSDEERTGTKRARAWNTITYWDVDRCEYRSFRISNMI